MGECGSVGVSEKECGIEKEWECGKVWEIMGGKESVSDSAP